MGNKAKAVKETPFSKFSATQLSPKRELDCDVYTEPPIQDDYNETMPGIKRNYCDAYKETWTKILKRLTHLSKYYDLDMLVKAFQDHRDDRDNTDTF